MATSSFEFDKLFQLRIDKNYNSYNSPIQRERLYKEALYNAFEYVYKRLDEQEEYDELRSFIKINTPLVPVNNAIDINAQLPSYNHYLFARGESLIPYNPTISFQTANYDGQKTTVSSKYVLPYRDGDKIKFYNVLIMSELNSDFYVKRIGWRTYQLFNDQELTVPFLANVSNVYTGDAGKCQQIIESNFIVQYSDERIQTLDVPSIRNPKIMIADNKIEILPNGCINFYLDYLTNPPIFVTQTNNVFSSTDDLELFYPMKFIYQILDKAVERFNMNTKDTESFREGVNYENLNQ